MVTNRDVVTMMTTGVAAAGAINAVRCCQCGKPARGGATDLLGRFRCEDCARAWEGVKVARARQQASDEEAQRRSMVAAEVSEREAMMGLTPPT